MGGAYLVSYAVEWVWSEVSACSVLCSNRKKAEMVRDLQEMRKVHVAAKARGGGRGGGMGRGGGGVGRGLGRGGVRGGMKPTLEVDVETLRQQEAEAISKMQGKKNLVSPPFPPSLSLSL